MNETLAQYPLLSPLIILLAAGLYGLIHSSLASLKIKSVVEKPGTLGARIYRLAYNLFALISLLPVLALPGILPDIGIYHVPAPWRWLFLAVQIAAAVMGGIAVLQTDTASFLGLRQLFETAAERDNSAPRLIIHGLYTRMRHPIYTAGMLFVWFNPVMTLNTVALNIGATLYFIIGAAFEERKLRREFGPAYEQYSQTTPMFIPGLGRRASR